MLVLELGHRGWFVSGEGSRYPEGLRGGESLTFPRITFCTAFETLLCVHMLLADICAIV